MLNQTLKALPQDGLISRTVHDGTPPRVDYCLTAIGDSLREPIVVLATWADHHAFRIVDARAEFDRYQQHD